MNNIDQILNRDDNLRQAVRQREQKQPTLPTDLNERLMQRLGWQEQKAKYRHAWLYPAIAVAASILLLIILHNPQTENPVSGSQGTSCAAEMRAPQYEDEWTTMEQYIQRQREIRERGERLTAYVNAHRSTNIE